VPFNITAEAQTLAPFTAGEVAELLGQHTAATGQRFAPEATALVHELSAGHPWLVNALADQATLDVRDRARAIEAAQIETAKETIILERRTHIDSLAARLRESRVQRIVEPMLLGNGLPDGIDEDLQYVAGLGLIRVEAGQWRVANPIYREVIPRASRRRPAPTGRLAFLQRVVNGGGRVEREYGLGRGRLDLIVEWRGERHLIELKLRRGKRAEERALAQLARYLDGAWPGRGLARPLRSAQGDPLGRQAHHARRRDRGEADHRPREVSDRPALSASQTSTELAAASSSIRPVRSR
jgi:hypothetical protein